MLRGRDVRNKANKRIPFWIDYHNCTVNDVTIVDKTTPAWHDEPIKFSCSVQDGELVRMHFEWEPHDERK